MAEKKVIELEVKENFGNLKQQLKAAQLEVQTLADKFGDTSAQAVEAAKKAAILKDKIGDAKALTDAFNPDAKFKALSGALTGVAGGFSVVTGAMGAFGKQNEDVEKALLKVQSAMALASGAQAIGESIDSFKQLGAVIKANSVFQKILTAGQYAYNLAMALNPIGAIVVAVIALIASGYALIKMFQASEQANVRNELAVKKNTSALKEQIKSSEKASEALKTKNGHEYEMAKASGASSESLRKLAVKHAEAQIALEKSTLATAKDTYEKNKNTLANLINSGASDELIQKQRELTTEARKAVTEERKQLETAVKDKADIIRKNAVEVRQEITDNNNKIKDANKTHNEAIKQENEEKAKTELDRIKSLNENIVNLQEEARVAKLTNEQKEVDALNKKYDKTIEDGKKAKIDVSALEEEKRLALLGVTKKYDDLEKVASDEKTAKEKEKIATEKAFLDELTLSEDELKLQKITAKYEAEKLLYKDNKEILKALDVKYDKDKQDLENKELARKRENTKKGIDMAMSALSVLNDAIQMGAGKSEKSQRKAFKAQKAFNLASAVVNTYLAVTGALTAGGNPIKLATGAQFVEAGIAGALGAVQIAKIAKTQFEGGASADTSGGGGGGGGGVTAPTMSAPQFNVVGQSGVNQLASLGQQPVQAYVVSGQVTSQQSLDRNRLANATLGG
jgi:DNA repair exonuclease SbcCD ATPase subunit